MIKPTIGRVVWFWPCDATREALGFAYGDKTLPLSARVAYVWSDRMVNLAFEDQHGLPFSRTSVLLLQGDESYAPVGDYCEWMPYQKGQAEKAQATQYHPDTQILIQGLKGTPAGEAVLASWDRARKESDAFAVCLTDAAATKVTDDMVSRFLGWTFPLDFAPDGGISHHHMPGGAWPIGTNLLNGIQARAMLEHVLAAEVSPCRQNPMYTGPKQCSKGNVGCLVNHPIRADGTVLNTCSTDVEPSLSPFDFGGALNVLRLGGKVARKGWNGKGMWVTLAGPAGGSTVNHEKFWSPNNAKFAKDQPDGAVTVNPYFTIKNTDNTISNWVPSTGDILALDWVTVQ